MTPALTLCLPFYRNPGMLAEQYRIWAAYPEAAKAQLEVVLVDDGSPEPAFDVPRPAGLPALRIYRVGVDIPWHQHGARNLAAKEAAAPWLLCTDMDHILPGYTLEAILPLVQLADARSVYTFHRVDAPALTPTTNERGQAKPHVNSFLITKAHYWSIGGYDEDCVGYGTDSHFRTRLKAQSRMKHLNDLHLVRVPREVVPDASGSAPGMDPKVFRNQGRRTAETQRRLAMKRAKGITAPTVLAFPWERVL